MMYEIKTNFGSIFYEYEKGINRRCNFYDSNGAYLDYLPYDCREERSIVRALLENVKTNKYDVFQFLAEIGYLYHRVFNDFDKFVEYIKENNYLDDVTEVTPENIRDNECFNRVGNYFLIYDGC